MAQHLIAFFQRQRPLRCPLLQETTAVATSVFQAPHTVENLDHWQLIPFVLQTSLESVDSFICRLSQLSEVGKRFFTTEKGWQFSKDDLPHSGWHILRIELCGEAEVS